MSSKLSKKSNSQLLGTVQMLETVYASSQSALWRDVARRLSSPRSNWAAVNLYKLQRFASDGETVLIPGKLLASGELTRKVTVAAYSTSKAAARKIEAAGSKLISIEELATSNPKGSGVKIIV
ncbi:MAG: 50S ribosomal protein L18e [Methanomassiliicoccales archaeon]